MVYNVYPGLFSKSGLRMGDLIALCNFTEHLRKVNRNQDIRFHVPDHCLATGAHCRNMLDHLVYITNYLHDRPGTKTIPMISGTDETYPDLYNLWNIRRNVLFKIQNVFEIEDAVRINILGIKNENTTIIAPLFDADYNTDRNWSDDVLLKAFGFVKYDKIIIVTKSIHLFEMQYAKILPNIVNKISMYVTEFNEVLQQIQTCNQFIGGDTGLSHYASALQPRPDCKFLYPTTTYGTTNPFYWNNYKDNMYYY